MTRLTVHETGMQLIRQRGTSTSSPEFIAAYLAEEHRRDPLCHLPPLARQMTEVGQATTAAFAVIAARMRIAVAVVHHAMEPFASSASESGPP